MAVLGGLLTRAAGAQKREAGKTAIIGCIIAVNVMLSALSWILPDFWFVFMPFIAGACLVNSAMVLSLLGFWAVRRTRAALSKRRSETGIEKAKRHVPGLDVRGIAFVVPCYNESQQEIEDTLHSLLAQEDMERHRRVFVVCCDGRVKARGAEKETSRILTENIFAPSSGRSVVYVHTTYLRAYRTWLGDWIDIEFQCGMYHGVPYILLIKAANRGKRDTLILVRSLLHKYNLRADPRSTRYSAEFFESFAVSAAGTLS
jgi:chitin synthase